MEEEGKVGKEEGGGGRGDAMTSFVPISQVGKVRLREVIGGAQSPSWEGGDMILMPTVWLQSPH